MKSVVHLRRLLIVFLTMIMMVVPTKFGLVAASVATTTSRMTTAQRLGFSSAKPYMATILKETAGKNVQLDKALAMEGEEFTDIVIPTVEMGAISLRLDRMENVVKRVSMSIVEDKTTATATMVEDGKTVMVATVDKATGQLTSGWAIRDGQKIDLSKEPPPAPVGDKAGACSFRQWWACMNTCFQQFGTPGYILSLIAYFCAGPCERAASSAVCLTCFVGTGFLLGYMLYACVISCWVYEW